jgi:hypothetical protein
MMSGCTTHHDSDDAAKPEAAVTPAEITPPSVVQNPPAPDNAAGPTATPSSVAAPAPPSPPFVTPGKIEALLVPVAELDDLVGAKLGFEKQFNRPGAAAGGLGEKSGCAVLFGANSDTYANQYTAFRRSSVRDGEDSSQHFVAQEAATFADADAANKNFQAAFNKQALEACNGAVVHRQGDDDRIKWKLNVKNITGDSAQWTLAQESDGKPNDWICAHEARVKSNVELGVTVCQFGNAEPAATGVIDRMSGWVPQP